MNFGLRQAQWSYFYLFSNHRFWCFKILDCYFDVQSFFASNLLYARINQFIELMSIINHSSSFISELSIKRIFHRFINDSHTLSSLKFVNWVLNILFEYFYSFWWIMIYLIDRDVANMHFEFIKKKRQTSWIRR